MPIRLEDPPPTQRDQRRDLFAALLADLRAALPHGRFFRLAEYPVDPKPQIRPLEAANPDIEFVTGRQIAAGPDRGKFGVWARVIPGVPAPTRAAAAGATK